MQAYIITEKSLFKYYATTFYSAKFYQSMAWQDITITICILAFSYALIPQIVKGFKNKKSLIATQTSLITSIGMFAIAITYITLNLTFSAIIALLTGALWATLFIQNIIYKNN